MVRPRWQRMREILRGYVRREVPPTFAIMDLLMASEDAALALTAARDAAERARSTHARSAHRRLVALMERHRAGCDRVAAMLASGRDHGRMLPSVDEGIVHSRRLFDWSVRQSPAASVALHSLGDERLLARVTREIVAYMRGARLLGRERDTLEIGCGIGRMQLALSPLVRRAGGLDVSPGMVAEARRRCRGLANVAIHLGDGRTLAAADASLDLVYAVDSFPYVVQSGMPLARALIREAARCLRPGGHLLLLNFSYRPDHRRDHRDFRRLCAGVGLRVLGAGHRPFRHWEGEVYLAQKAYRKRQDAKTPS